MTATQVKEARVREVPFANNLLTNPGFENWQRGNGPFITTGTSNVAGFCADEWAYNCPGGTQTINRSSSALFGNYCTSSVYTHGSGGLTQGLEAWKSLEGRWITLSVWVYCDTLGAAYSAISDWSTVAVQSNRSPVNTKVNEWELLTVTKLIQTSLNPAASTGWSHDYPITMGVGAVLPATIRMDGAVCAAGYFPEGLMYRPPNPARDFNRCERYYQVGGDVSAAWGPTAMWTGKTTNGHWYYLNTSFSTVMAAVPTMTLTDYAYGSFPAGPSTSWCDGARGFWIGRIANATNNRGYFGDYWQAEVP